jgi:DNA-binding beta-propeller fold protein YncE
MTPADVLGEVQQGPAVDPQLFEGLVEDVRIHAKLFLEHGFLLSLGPEAVKDAVQNGHLRVIAFEEEVVGVTVGIGVHEDRATGLSVPPSTSDFLVIRFQGKPLNSNAAQFFGPSAVDVDPQNGDVYIADGHGGGNTRIAVLDKNGKFLRQWPLHHTEAEKNIEVLPHCMRLSNDGLVYVCDRQANRLQAFDKMGNFQRNIDIPWNNYTPENGDLRKYCHTLWRTFPPCTLVQKIGRGTSAVSVEFSRDSNQRFLYVVNQNQREVDILDRATGKVVSTIGHGAGLFFQGQLFDAIRAAVDSKGNVYVAEDEGRRLQRFKIIGP